MAKLHFHSSECLLNRALMDISQSPPILFKTEFIITEPKYITLILLSLDPPQHPCRKPAPSFHIACPLGCKPAGYFSSACTVLPHEHHEWALHFLFPIHNLLFIVNHTDSWMKFEIWLFSTLVYLTNCQNKKFCIQHLWVSQRAYLICHCYQLIISFHSPFWIIQIP